jgi:hypothetical protein
MHKNIPVIDVTIDKTGYIAKLREVYDIRRLPPGIEVSKNGANRKDLNDWWLKRSIPVSRSGLDAALLNIGIASPVLLLEKSFGLSLSDQYWLSPKNSGLLWENINFFQNVFSNDMGDILFGHKPQNPKGVNLISPDNTSDGWLKKRWIIADGKRYLMKGGSGVYRQEPFNEVIASRLMRRLNIRHVHYELSYGLSADKKEPYSLCENFITPDTELIPAWRMLKTQKKPNSRSLRDHFLVCCESLGVPEAETALNKMLTVDYIIANEDRHFNNFGCVRSADTLKWLGLAPVFDSGTSLWYNTQRVGENTQSKPFRATHGEQIKLVNDLSWFNIDLLKGFENEIIDIFSESAEIDEERRTLIARHVTGRAAQLAELHRTGNSRSDNG